MKMGMAGSVRTAFVIASMTGIGAMASLASEATARDARGVGSSHHVAQNNDAGSQGPVPAEPRQTSAAFGDWVVRCDRSESGSNAKRVCEAAQSLVIKGQQAPIAQIAFAREATGKADAAMLLTVLLPVSIAFDRPPKLGSGAAPAGDDPQAAKLAFRRCLPVGCLADAKPDADLLKDLRTSGKPGHLTFTDAAERTISLPVSFRGLAQALDYAAREATQDSPAGPAQGH